MNDFTKEELEIISGSLCFTLLMKHSSQTNEVRMKVKSMIDNYCQKDNRIMIEVNKPIDSSPNTKCYKCKSEFFVHPMTSNNAEFILNCELHNE